MRLALCFLFVAAVLPSLAHAQSDSPLNLLLVMDDQHNPRMLGGDSNGYGGVPQSLTPNLDDLASEGVSFSNAYTAAPQCVPTRFTILTGRDPHTHGVRWNQVWEPARGELTLPELARRHGYVTGTVGKHHMAWLDQAGTPPTDHGFDHVLDTQDYQNFCKDHGVRTWSDPANSHVMRDIDAGYSFSTNEFHPAGYFADQAIAFLEDRAGPGGDGKPFVLWLSFPGPHKPILPSGPADPEDWAHLYHPFAQLDLPGNLAKVADAPRLQQVQVKWVHLDGDEHREALSYYFGLVSQIDFNIGRVVDRLAALGIDDRTVVVFTSDHGEFAAEMACWMKGGGLYDCLTRIPLVIRAPGQIVSGQVLDAPTASGDLVPTLAELLGLTPSPLERMRWTGRSLAEMVLAGEVPSDWPEVTFSEFGPPDSYQTRMAVGREDKYVFDEWGASEEYFDLGLDPWEMDNRIADPLAQPRVDELRSQLAAWWGNEADHAPNYGVTGLPGSAPLDAASPVPQDHESGVAVRVDPGWLPATSAASQEVWFGIDPGQLELFTVLPPMADRFNPGTLARSTTYYWRVDGINAHGVTPGAVWRFTTLDTGRGGPGLAHSPAPGDEASSVPRGVVLAWKSGAGTMAHDVWFGPQEGPLVRVVKGRPTVRYTPPELQAGRAYVWRVDGIDLEGRTKGDEWTFTVDEAGLADAAGVPYPQHLAAEVVLAAGEPLSWLSGTGAVEHDVYFGTEFPLPYLGRRSAATFDPGALAPDTTYYWRIDEVNDAGVRTGFTWRFATKE